MTSTISKTGKSRLKTRLPSPSLTIWQEFKSNPSNSLLLLILATLAVIGGIHLLWERYQRGVKKKMSEKIAQELRKDTGDHDVNLAASGADEGYRTFTRGTTMGGSIKKAGNKSKRKSSVTGGVSRSIDSHLASPSSSKRASRRSSDAALSSTISTTTLIAAATTPVTHSSQTAKNLLFLQQEDGGEFPSAPEAVVTGLTSLSAEQAASTATVASFVSLISVSSPALSPMTAPFTQPPESPSPLRQLSSLPPPAQLLLNPFDETGTETGTTVTVNRNPFEVVANGKKNRSEKRRKSSGARSKSATGEGVTDNTGQTSSLEIGLPSASTSVGPSQLKSTTLQVSHPHRNHNQSTNVPSTSPTSPIIAPKGPVAASSTLQPNGFDPYSWDGRSVSSSSSSASGGARHSLKKKVSQSSIVSVAVVPEMEAESSNAWQVKENSMLKDISDLKSALLKTQQERDSALIREESCFLEMDDMRRRIATLDAFLREAAMREAGLQSHLQNLHLTHTSLLHHSMLLERVLTDLNLSPPNLPTPSPSPSTRRRYSSQLGTNAADGPEPIPSRDLAFSVLKNPATMDLPRQQPTTTSATPPALTPEQFSPASLYISYDHEGNEVIPPPSSHTPLPWDNNSSPPQHPQSDSNGLPLDFDPNTAFTLPSFGSIPTYDERGRTLSKKRDFSTASVVSSDVDASISSGSETRSTSAEGSGATNKHQIPDLILSSPSGSGTDSPTRSESLNEDLTPLAVFPNTSSDPSSKTVRQEFVEEATKLRMDMTS